MCQKKGLNLSAYFFLRTVALKLSLVRYWSIHESAYRALLIDEQNLTQEKPNCFGMTVSFRISSLTCLREMMTKAIQKYKD